MNSGIPLRFFFRFPTARPNYLSYLLPVSHCNRESVLRRVMPLDWQAQGAVLAGR